VEAGLRSFDPHNPFPEEINRRLTDAVSVLHFAPTQTAKKNLLREGVSPKGIFITGNTGIDALHLGLGKLKRNRPPAIGHREFILVTAHRRENFGKPLDNICRAIRRVARARPGLRFVYPVHPNPNVGGTVRALLGSVPNVSLLPPLDYAEFLPLLRDCRFVLTDSGGLQEEAPSLGKPVLVLRKVTERPEAVRAGTVRIIGTDERAVRRWMERLLDDNGLYRRMANAVNPYGDGRAAARTVEAIAGFFHLGPKRFKDFRPAGFRRR
jgi:UDP-N-acetylglucosamine 2-epimerase (non-hydrolysing)